MIYTFGDPQQVGYPLDRQMIESGFREIWESGRRPSQIVVSPAGAAAIFNLFAQEMGNLPGGMLVRHIQTPFGPIPIVLDRWCPPDKVYIFQEGSWSTRLESRS